MDGIGVNQRHDFRRMAEHVAARDRARTTLRQHGLDLARQAASQAGKRSGLDDLRSIAAVSKQRWW